MKSVSEEEEDQCGLGGEERLGCLSSHDAKSALVRVPWVHGSVVRLRRDEGDGLCSGLVGLPTRYSYPTRLPKSKVRVMGFIAVR